jgi:hypothetical protein
LPNYGKEEFQNLYRDLTGQELQLQVPEQEDNEYARIQDQTYGKLGSVLGGWDSTDAAQLSSWIQFMGAVRTSPPNRREKSDHAKNTFNAFWTKFAGRHRVSQEALRDALQLSPEQVLDIVHRPHKDWSDDGTMSWLESPLPLSPEEVGEVGARLKKAQSLRKVPLEMFQGFIESAAAGLEDPAQGAAQVPIKHVLAALYHGGLQEGVSSKRLLDMGATKFIAEGRDPDLTDFDHLTPMFNRDALAERQQLARQRNISSIFQQSVERALHRHQRLTPEMATDAVQQIRNDPSQAQRYLEATGKAVGKGALYGVMLMNPETWPILIAMQSEGVQDALNTLSADLRLDNAVTWGVKNATQFWADEGGINRDGQMEGYFEDVRRQWGESVARQVRNNYYLPSKAFMEWHLRTRGRRADAPDDFLSSSSYLLRSAISGLSEVTADDPLNVIGLGLAVGLKPLALKVRPVREAAMKWGQLKQSLKTPVKRAVSDWYHSLPSVRERQFARIADRAASLDSNAKMKFLEGSRTRLDAMKRAGIYKDDLAAIETVLERLERHNDGAAGTIPAPVARDLAQATMGGRRFKVNDTAIDRVFDLSRKPAAGAEALADIALEKDLLNRAFIGEKFDEHIQFGKVTGAELNRISETSPFTIRGRRASAVNRRAKEMYMRRMERLDKAEMKIVEQLGNDYNDQILTKWHDADAMFEDVADTIQVWTKQADEALAHVDTQAAQGNWQLSTNLYMTVANQFQKLSREVADLEARAQAVDMTAARQLMAQFDDALTTQARQHWTIREAEIVRDIGDVPLDHIEFFQTHQQLLKAWKRAKENKPFGQTRVGSDSDLHPFSPEGSAVTAAMLRDQLRVLRQAAPEGFDFAKAKRATALVDELGEVRRRMDELDAGSPLEGDLVPGTAEFARLRREIELSRKEAVRTQFGDIPDPDLFLKKTAALNRAEKDYGVLRDIFEVDIVAPGAENILQRAEIRTRLEDAKPIALPRLLDSTTRYKNTYDRYLAPDTDFPYSQSRAFREMDALQQKVQHHLQERQAVTQAREDMRSLREAHSRGMEVLTDPLLLPTRKALYESLLRYRADDVSDKLFQTKGENLSELARRALEFDPYFVETPGLKKPTKMPKDGNTLHAELGRAAFNRVWEKVNFEEMLLKRGMVKWRMQDLARLPLWDRVAATRSLTRSAELLQAQGQEWAAALIAAFDRKSTPVADRVKIFDAVFRNDPELMQQMARKYGDEIALAQRMTQESLVMLEEFGVVKPGEALDYMNRPHVHYQYADRELNQAVNPKGRKLQGYKFKEPDPAFLKRRIPQDHDELAVGLENGKELYVKVDSPKAAKEWMDAHSGQSIKDHEGFTTRVSKKARFIKRWTADERILGGIRRDFLASKATFYEGAFNAASMKVMNSIIRRWGVDGKHIVRQKDWQRMATSERGNFVVLSDLKGRNPIFEPLQGKIAVHKDLLAEMGRFSTDYGAWMGVKQGFVQAYRDLFRGFGLKSRVANAVGRGLPTMGPFGEKMLRSWKFARIAASLPVAFTNFLGNFVLSYWAGVPIFNPATDSLLNVRGEVGGTPARRVAKDWEKLVPRQQQLGEIELAMERVIQEAAVASDTGNVALAGNLKRQVAQFQKRRDFLRNEIENIGPKSIPRAVADTMLEHMGKGARNLSRRYGLIDASAKYATVKYLVDNKGLSMPQALRRVQDFMQDYTLLSGSVKQAGRSPFTPVPAFVSNVFRVLGNNLREQPMRLMKPFLYTYMWNMGALTASGQTPEEMLQQLQLQGRTGRSTLWDIADLMTNMVLPLPGEQGNVFLRADEVATLGMFSPRSFQSNWMQGAIPPEARDNPFTQGVMRFLGAPASAMLRGPMAQLGEIWFAGKDPGTSQSLNSKRSLGVSMLNRLESSAKMWTPGLAPGSYQFQWGYEHMKHKAQRFTGNTRPVQNVLLAGLGIPARLLRPDALVGYAVFDQLEREGKMDMVSVFDRAQQRELAENLAKTAGGNRAEILELLTAKDFGKDDIARLLTLDRKGFKTVLDSLKEKVTTAEGKVIERVRADSRTLSRIKQKWLRYLRAGSQNSFLSLSNAGRAQVVANLWRSGLPPSSAAPLLQAWLTPRRIKDMLADEADKESWHSMVRTVGNDWMRKALQAARVRRFVQ